MKIIMIFIVFCCIATCGSSDFGIIFDCVYIIRATAINGSRLKYGPRYSVVPRSSGLLIHGISSPQRS